MLLARVQHHPSRAHLLDRLVPGLGDIPVEVVEHDSAPPSPWLGYQLCLTDIPRQYEHLLVVQDDAVPCENLPLALTQVRDRWPNNPVCLFLGNLPMRTRREAQHAIGRGDRYIQIHPRDFVPCVAVLWPRAQAEDVLEWYQEQQKPRRHPDRADDGVIGRWMRTRGRTVMVALPSLFEHPDDVPSTIKLRNYRRNALSWATDAAHYDWT